MGKLTRNAQTTVRGGHFLEEDVGLFDAPFFNLSTETASVSNNDRLNMEVLTMVDLGSAV